MFVLEKHLLQWWGPILNRSFGLKCWESGNISVTKRKFGATQLEFNTTLFWGREMQQTSGKSCHQTTSQLQKHYMELSAVLCFSWECTERHLAFSLPNCGWKQECGTHFQTNNTQNNDGWHQIVVEWHKLTWHPKPSSKRVEIYWSSPLYLFEHISLFCMQSSFSCLFLCLCLYSYFTLFNYLFQCVFICSCVEEGSTVLIL